MMSENLLRVPEVARRLGMDGIEVYTLIERGELPAGKGEDGLVYVTSRPWPPFGKAPRRRPPPRSAQTHD